MIKFIGQKIILNLVSHCSCLFMAPRCYILSGLHYICKDLGFWLPLSKKCTTVEAKCKLMQASDDLLGNFKFIILQFNSIIFHVNLTEISTRWGSEKLMLRHFIKRVILLVNKLSFVHSWCYWSLHLFTFHFQVLNSLSYRRLQHCWS